MKRYTQIYIKFVCIYVCMWRFCNCVCMYVCVHVQLGWRKGKCCQSKDKNLKLFKRLFFSFLPCFDIENYLLSSLLDTIRNIIMLYTIALNSPRKTNGVILRTDTITYSRWKTGLYSNNLVKNSVCPVLIHN